MRNMKRCSKHKMEPVRYVTVELVNDILRSTTTTVQDRCVDCFVLDAIRPLRDSWINKRMLSGPWPTLGAVVGMLMPYLDER